MGEDASRDKPWVTFGFVRVRVRCALPAPADESDARTANSGLRGRPRSAGVMSWIQLGQ